MKLLLVFVGALCLVHGMDLEELMDTVNNAVGISRLKLATAIQQLNSTIETADQTYQTAWSQYYQSIVDLYTSYYNRFQNHSSIDLSPLSGAIDYLNRYAYPPSNISSHFVSDIVADLEKSATNIGGYLSLAVSIMTHDLFPCANPTVVHCIKKFGPKLITAPITIDRLAECVTTELPRLSTLSVRRASQYDIVLDSVKKHLKVVDVCDKPAAGVLTPSTECLSHVSPLHGNSIQTAL